MSNKSVNIVCPRCRREYVLTVDLAKLSRLKKRAVCARCGQVIDIAERLVKAEQDELRQSSSDLRAPRRRRRRKKHVTAKGLGATGYRRTYDEEVGLDPDDATLPAAKANAFEASIAATRRAEKEASAGVVDTSEMPTPRPPRIEQALEQPEPSQIESAESVAGPPSIPDLTADLEELSPWLELADPGLDTLVTDLPESVKLLEKLLAPHDLSLNELGSLDD